MALTERLQIILEAVGGSKVVGEFDKVGDAAQTDFGRVGTAGEKAAKLIEDAQKRMSQAVSQGQAKITAETQKMEAAQLKAAHAITAVERAQDKLASTVPGTIAAARAAEQLEAAELRASHAAQALSIAEGRVQSATDAAADSHRRAASDLRAAERATDDLADSSNEGSGILEKFGLSGISMGAAIKGGAIAAGTAIAAFVIGSVAKFADLAGEVDGIQDVLGGTAEQASKLRNVAASLGIETDKVSGAFFKLSQNIESGKLAEHGVQVALNRDGTKDLYGTLLNVADAYKATADQTQKNTLLNGVFGKSGKDLIDIVEKERKTLEALGRSGPIFNQKDLDNAREMAITMELLKRKGEQLAVSVGSKVVGALTEESSWFQENAKHGSKFEQVLKGVLHVTSGLDFGYSKTAKAAEDLERSQIALEFATKEAQEAIDKETQALEELLSATIASVSGVLSMERANNSFADAVVDVTEKEDALTAALAEFGEGSKEATEAARDLRDSKLGVREAALGAANAAVQLAQDEAALSGVTLTAEQRNDIFRNTLHELANQAEGPTSDAIRALAHSIREDLQDKHVTVTADASQANREISELSRRIAEIRNADLTVSAGTAYHEAQLEASGGVIPMFAGGGVPGFKTRGPRAIVGEGNPSFPEYVIATDPQYRARNIGLWQAAGRRIGMGSPGMMSTAGGGPTVNNNQTINVTPTAAESASPMAIAKAIAWELS